MNVKVFKKFADEVLKGFNETIDLPLKRKEIHLLSLLGFDDKQPLQFYAKHLGLEKGSFTYLVEIMEEKGYVMRHADEHDKRRKMLLLSDKGRKAANEIIELEQQHLDNFFSKINIEDYEILKKAEEVIHSILREKHRKE